MDIDHYIDWDLAREKLAEILERVIDTMRLCDVARLKGEFINPNDQLVASLLDAIDLEDEQVRQLSDKYTEHIAAIQKLAAQLGTGETHHGSDASDLPALGAG